ncbi:PadR family transcriptional regulator [Motilibacter aurantiacus]|uniref:PadR family transcriptional regulator n=1 Tax=Motilibacter aurantiacus TaxID=2714955 RepID=UPI00140BECB3|nr:PadR family transcriptional regulator [Motilibacter aurantiacus]
MSSTRLLVLGVVRFLQPVHGYDVRRELVSWRLEEWANVKAGSVYSALRTLEKDGLLQVTDRVQGEGRPERTEYVLTAEGEKEYFVLLREAWWTVRRPAEPLIPALTLMTSLPRNELVSAVRARIAQLEGQADELRFFRASIQDGATGADGQVPEHVREILDFAVSRVRGELDWSRAFVRHLRAGHYAFAGEEGAPGPGQPGHLDHPSQP